ncbi:phragmoplast-associated kinesin-related protein [Striga asiatica]|uniref:Phragmoplast-associated kinesin-related protein n=1 Tax=Striga asiatica TaxID=4170 RepID=A0A5A7QPQ8_STRAF|nr:phragmoplast-associated kinesin-related protein [Striga asiatica]
MSSSKSNHSTPSTKPNTAAHQSRTSQSKHRLQFTGVTTAAAGAVPSEHPVEVVGRIRDHPEQKNKPNANPTSALQINGDGKSLRGKQRLGIEISVSMVSRILKRMISRFFLS